MPFQPFLPCKWVASVNMNVNVKVNMQGGLTE